VVSCFHSIQMTHGHSYIFCFVVYVLKLASLKSYLNIVTKSLISSQGLELRMTSLVPTKTFNVAGE